MLTRTVKLIPGESFTLPPNASVLAVSGSLISTCGDLPTPETLGCYGIIYSVSDGSDSPSESNESVSIKGFRVNNEDYLFNTSYDHDAGAVDFAFEIQNRVSTEPYLAGILSDICAGRYVSDSSRGSAYVISFKSLPSLMSNTQIIMHMAAFPGGATTKVLVPVRARAELAIDGLPGDNCPCV